MKNLLLFFVFCSSSICIGQHLNEKNNDKNIVGHWSLDGNAMDNSSYGLNGEIIGSPKTVDGVLDGNAMEFNGKEFVEIDI